MLVNTHTCVRPHGDDGIHHGTGAFGFALELWRLMAAKPWAASGWLATRIELGCGVWLDSAGLLRPATRTLEGCQDVAREADAAGFEAIFTTEVNNDAMATAQLMGSRDGAINVGTWTANIYLRHPCVCAQGASFIAALTGGRFILGSA